MDVLHSLGYGAVYNHNEIPNIEFRVLDNIIIEFTAITDIEVGDEICHNYGPYNSEKKSKFI
jgi:SET domain-containing protein